MPPHDANHLAGADIRGFYAALGIPLPSWAARASVRCFADPEAHRRGDRDPSCSVNLTHGAWHCHGCGASGGPYDAATHQGHSSRSAIDLMISTASPNAGLRPTAAPAPILRNADTRPRVVRPASPRFTISESDINHWRSALSSDTPLVERLVRERGWQLETMRELELGVDRGRITIPVRDRAAPRRAAALPAVGKATTDQDEAAVAPATAAAPPRTTSSPQRICARRGRTRHDRRPLRGLAAIAVPGPSPGDRHGPCSPAATSRSSWTATARPRRRRRSPRTFAPSRDRSSTWRPIATTATTSPTGSWRARQTPRPSVSAVRLRQGRAMAANSYLPDPLWGGLIEELASRVADQLALQLAKVVSESHGPGPWLTTAEAIKYMGLPDGTFRKLAACGKIPSHGGRSKIFFRPEIDQALLSSAGLTQTLALRSVR